MGAQGSARPGGRGELRGGCALCVAGGGRRARAGGGRAGGSRGEEWGGGPRRHTPPLASGLNACEEPPPPPLGVVLSPRFPSAPLAWQLPRRLAPRPARGGPAPPPGPSAESVGSSLALRPGARRLPARGKNREGRGALGWERSGDLRPGAATGEIGRGRGNKSCGESGVGGGDCSMPGTGPCVAFVLEVASSRCPHPRPRLLLRPDLALHCPSFTPLPQSPLMVPVCGRLASSNLSRPALLLPPPPSSIWTPLSPLSYCHSEPESVPLSLRLAASQPVLSHRCPHIRRPIRPSLLGLALTMPSGCRCLHLVCLLCILGAPVKPVRGERSPGLRSWPCPAVDLCWPEMALQPLRPAGLATPGPSLWNGMSLCSVLLQS